MNFYPIRIILTFMLLFVIIILKSGHFPKEIIEIFFNNLCFQLENNKEDNESTSVAIQINQLIHLNQQKCTHERIAIETHSGTQGLGVQFISYAASLSLALQQNKTFEIIDKGWNYGDSETNRNFFHYFESISNCPPAEKTEVHRIMLGKANLNTSRNPRDIEVFIHHSSLFKVPEYFKETVSNFDLKSYEKPLERLWEAQMVSNIFKPKKWILDKVEYIKNQLNFSKSPIIGMHIRRGDRKELLHFKLSQYLEKANFLRSNFGVHRIFIASDDPQFIQEELLNLNCDFEILSLDLPFKNILDLQNELNFNDENKNNENKNENNDANNENNENKNEKEYEISQSSSYKYSKSNTKNTLLALLDLILLSETQFYIGAQRSMFSWISTRLMISKKNEKFCPQWVDLENLNLYGWLATGVERWECL